MALSLRASDPTGFLIHPSTKMFQKPTTTGRWESPLAEAGGRTLSLNGVCCWRLWERHDMVQLSPTVLTFHPESSRPPPRPAYCPEFHLVKSSLIKEWGDFQCRSQQTYDHLFPISEEEWSGRQGRTRGEEEPAIENSKQPPNLHTYYYEYEKKLSTVVTTVSRQTINKFSLNFK